MLSMKAVFDMGSFCTGFELFTRDGCIFPGLENSAHSSHKAPQQQDNVTMTMLTIIDLLLFVALLYCLLKLRKRGHTLSRQILIGMLLGLGYGFYLQVIHDGDVAAIDQTLAWTQVTGDIYVALLQ